MNIIKNTIAKGATNDELQLFIYRAKSMGLDPLKPGQIHFVKYGNSPGTIVVGIDGFRAKAAATGKHSGTKRGVLRDDKGQCIGAWCEVYRSDWQQPAREEVSLNEYNTNRGPWQKMPETMIKKVAECAALRMAFPDELGGVYSNEEMDQAAPKEARKLPEKPTIQDLIDNPPPTPEPDDHPQKPGDYVVRAGKKYVGQRLSDIGQEDVAGFLDWIQTKGEKVRDREEFQEFAFFAKLYLESGDSTPMPFVADEPWPDEVK
jgi:phage recombination protein Bet